MSLDTPSSVHAIILSLDKNKILLIKRRDVPVWVIPGGGVENNELPKDAIIREITEETGAIPTSIKQIGTYLPKSKWSNTSFLYLSSIDSSKLKSSTKEAQEIKFFNLNHLPKKIPPPFLEFINDSQTFNYSYKKRIKSLTMLVQFKCFILHPILAIRFFLARCGFPINSN